MFTIARLNIFIFYNLHISDTVFYIWKWGASSNTSSNAAWCRLCLLFCQKVPPLLTPLTHVEKNIRNFSMTMYSKCRRDKTRLSLLFRFFQSQLATYIFFISAGQYHLQILLIFKFFNQLINCIFKFCLYSTFAKSAGYLNLKLSRLFTFQVSIFGSCLPTFL